MSFYLPAIHNPSSVSLFHGCLSETTRAAHRADMFWDGVEHLSRFPPVHRTEWSPPPTWHLRTAHTWHTVPAWGCHPLCPSTHLFGLAGSQASLGPFLPTLLGCDLHTSCTFRLCLLDLSHRQLRGPQTPRGPAAAQSPASLLAQGIVCPSTQHLRCHRRANAPRAVLLLSQSLPSLRLRCSLNPGEKLEQDPPSLPVQSWSRLSSLLSLTSRETFN